jgi:hypothetical protein
MSTTITDLRQQLAPRENTLPAVEAGLTTLAGFELAQRAAKLLASSTLVPKQYQGNLANCVIALNIAQRTGADPLMVMQNLYVVHGTPSWSAQFLIAAFNQSGKFSSLRYEWSGTEGKDDWSCRAWALEKSTNETLRGAWVSIALAKKEGWYAKQGSKWVTMPQQMLMYRAASWFVRAYAPELAMGLNTAEEIRDVYDAAPAADGTFEVAGEKVDSTTSKVPDKQQDNALREVEDFFKDLPKDVA